MALFDDLVHGSGASYFYDLEDAPGGAFASGAGATAATAASSGTASTGPTGAGVTATASAAQAHGYRRVTIAAPIRTGPDSIFYPPRFSGTPAVGDVVRFPARDGFNILSDGTIVADQYGTYDCYYNDGGGEDAFTVVLSANADVYAAGASATASASTSSQYGGVNIAGDAPDVTATPAAGTGTAGNIATGAGAQAGVTAPGAGVAGGGAASGAGPAATATPSAGVAEILVTAQGAGAEAAASPAQGSASGDVIAVGAGVTATATPAAATGVGDRLPGSIPYAVLTVVYPNTLLAVRAAA